MALLEAPAGSRASWLHVGDSRTRLFEWGHGAPTVLLIHGGGAHSGWWFDTVAAMGPHQRIVSMDLSGHGDSDIRGQYSFTRWTDEAEAVLESIGGAVLVAHSMGGRIGAMVASRRPDLVRSLVLLDSVLPTHDNEPMPAPSGKRVYPSMDDAAARFRLAPPTDTTPEDVRDRLARASITETEGGYTWKFDTAVFFAPDEELVNAAIPGILCPIVLVHADESPVTEPEMAAHFERLLGRPFGYLALERADHHFMVNDAKRAARLLESFEAIRPTA